MKISMNIGQIHYHFTKTFMKKRWQQAVYNNRLEISSPGKLPIGQTMERMKEGYSKIRNEALAHAFVYMNMIEHWGSGIPRIIDKVKATGLPFNKKQTQIEKLLQIIEKNLSATQAYYAEEIICNNLMYIEGVQNRCSLFSVHILVILL